MLENTLQFIRSSVSDWQAKGLNEAQTCQAIILRILQDLNYDIWNPFEVFPQDTNTKGAGRPDYLIYLENKEKFVIEAKALNKEFSDTEYTQTVNYVNAKGLRWAILTNGIKWLFFDNVLKGTIKQKLALTLELNNVYFEKYLSLLLDRNHWLTNNASEEMAHKIQLIYLISFISEKSKFYAKTTEGLDYLVERELDNKAQQLAKENRDFLLSFYLNGTVAFSSPKNKQKPLSQTPLQNPQQTTVDLFVEIISTFKKEESGKKQVKIKVADQEIAFLSWKDIHFSLVEMLVKLDRLGEVKNISKIVEKDARNLSNYSESAYNKLSNGNYLYVHYSAIDHEKNVKKLLEILGFSIEIIYKNSAPISLPSF